MNKLGPCYTCKIHLENEQYRDSIVAAIGHLRKGNLVKVAMVLGKHVQHHNPEKAVH